MVQSCSAHTGISNVEKTVLGSIKCCTVVFALGWVGQFVSFFPLTNCGDHNNPFGGFCHLNKPTSLAQIYVNLVH
jgi:hypothetical protein